MANVLLLRAPATDAPDKYEDALRARGYHPLSVPVLETVLVNLPELVQFVAAGPERSGLGGVIVTSARGCEAWRAVVSELVKNNVATDAGKRNIVQIHIVFPFDIDRFAAPQCNRVDTNTVLCSRRGYGNRPRLHPHHHRPRACGTCATGHSRCYRKRD